jgi:plasmid maintenance system killer protein
LELVYASDKVKNQCTSVKAAKKLFGGDTILTTSLLARINALEKAETIKDIIVQPTFHFHNLGNKQGRNLEGFFAIYVKSRKEQWRIVLQPLDANKEPFTPCYIDQISSYVRIVEITEVSKHYE